MKTIIAAILLTLSFNVTAQEQSVACNLAWEEFKAARVVEAEMYEGFVKSINSKASKSVQYYAKLAWITAGSVTIEIQKEVLIYCK